MTAPPLFARWFGRPAVRGRARAEAIIYVDGPITRWLRSGDHWKFEEHPGGLRIPLSGPQGVMPRPDDREIVDRREFRSAPVACLWVIWRLKGFDHTKLVGEVRPL